MPLSVPISEDDIIQQVIQKFRINSQLQNSKLVMRLHPAELGELKIDIQLKGGSLNASIVTQSQQVREILEKNMPKLRDLMEQHGIVVENISVKIETETIADYNLFQQQFSREGNPTDSKKSARTDTSFELSLETSVNDELTPKSGVNVTV
jgi:flagellar hook-length control protein FliK